MHQPNHDLKTALCTTPPNPLALPFCLHFKALEAIEINIDVSFMAEHSTVTYSQHFEGYEVLHQPLPTVKKKVESSTNLFKDSVITYPFSKIRVVDRVPLGSKIS